MVRVTKKGGRIVMGNWIPNDPTLVAQLLKISSRTAAAAARVRQPDEVGGRVGRDRAFRRRRHPGRARVVRAQAVQLRLSGTPIEYADIMRTYYGPTMNAVEAADRAAGSTT
jgi:hypothetical protein